MKIAVITVALLLLAGCSWLSGGQDEKVVEAKQVADEANVEAKAARVELAEIAKRVELGTATADDLKAAITKFDAKVTLADDAIADLDSAIETAAAKSAPLATWGASAGSVFGPVGAAAGGILGMIASGIMAWRRGRSFKALLSGVQAAREELFKSNPGASQASDEALRKAIPKEVQEIIRALKKKGVISELPA
jgi:hypothetical protein